jgi:signal transduction histidine kinase
MAAFSRAKALPPDAKARLLEFAELMGTVIANAESRAALAASRARIVAASDEARRRIERDLHDGAQQRLVSLALELRAAQAAVPAELGQVRSELDEVAEGMAALLDELRTISRGIHPAVLDTGGLAPAVKALARRSAVPVFLNVRVDERFSERVEVAAYYVVSEALTNVAKHSRAASADVEVERRGDLLYVSVHDNGVGGADPAGGSGLVGLRDRVEALGGSLSLDSPAGGGTSLEAVLPLDETARIPP